MIITQDELIKQISRQEDIDVATVRQIFKSAENCIFDYLSSNTPMSDITIKVFNGLSLNRKYIPEKNCSKGRFKNCISKEHYNISGTVI